MNDVDENLKKFAGIIVQGQPSPPLGTPAKPKRQRKPRKRTGRAARWEEACAAAREALQAMQEQMTAFEEAMGNLRAVQEEFESWKDNMPESLASSPLGEKLEEVCSLQIDTGDIETALDATDNALAEAEGVDLPRGFGRD